jgi:hypothetical protein
MKRHILEANKIVLGIQEYKGAAMTLDNKK